jgi:ABC-type multidrug transport system fused ATPase/permease subunit
VREDPVEVLVRQVDSMINRERSGTNALGPSVPYSKLYSLASSSDKTLMIIGWIAAGIAGFGMPSFVFIIGNVIDSFDTTKTGPSEMLDTISFMCLLFTIIGCGVWVTSYVNYGFLLMFSERVAKKTRVKYLEAILKQESAWFDTTNPSELSARLGKETLAI